MHAPRFLAAIATVVACLAVQACSDSDNDGNTDGAEAPPPAAGPAPEGLPAPPPAPPPALEGIDACSVLTVQSVETVIGEDMDGPTTGPTAGGGRGEGKMSSCSFASHAESENAAPAQLLEELGDSWTVKVTVWVWPESGDGARNYINAMRDAPMTDDPVQNVDGLADEAVWNGTLHARQGNTTLSVDVRPARNAENPEEMSKERQLMEQALERL